MTYDTTKIDVSGATYDAGDNYTIWAEDWNEFVTAFKAHAERHKSGGDDAIKLDELAAPTDVTTLDVSIASHGLCPKLPNDITKFLSGDGTWRVVSTASDVTGPSSSVDGNIVTFGGITGKVIKDGLVALSSVALTGDAPSAHAASHGTGESDAITIAESQVTDLTTHLGLKAPISSPIFTDVPTAPTAPNGTATTQLATTAFVQNTIAYLDPLLYKGVIDCSANPNYPAADAGNTYIISVSGKIGGVSGKTATIGDMLICNHDGSPSGDEAAVGTYWNLITVNTGAIIGPASSTDGHLVAFDGPSGKLVKDGGAIPVVPAFDTTPTNIKMNGTQAVGSSGLIPNSDHVHPTDTSRAAATALGTWAGFSSGAIWSVATPTVSSTVARFVRNGNVVTFAVKITITDGLDAVLDSLALPAATAQIANLEVQLSSFKSYTDGVDTVMSDPFAYIDFNAATPLIKFHSVGSFPTGCSAVLNIAGSYEVEP